MNGKAPRIAYKRRSVDDRRRDLISELEGLDRASRALRDDIRAVSSGPGQRSHFRTPREFHRYVGKAKHELVLNRVKRENVRKQISRCNRIIENRRKEHASRDT